MTEIDEADELKEEQTDNTPDKRATKGILQEATVEDK